jgi:hypothetical protein
MSNNRISQVTGQGFQAPAQNQGAGQPIASIPGGPNNIQLNSGGGGGGTATPDQMKQILMTLLQAYNASNPDQVKTIASRIQSMIPGIKDMQAKRSLQAVVSAASFNADPKKLTPGKPTVPQAISSTMNVIQTAEMLNQSGQTQQQPQQRQQPQAPQWQGQQGSDVVNIYMTNPQQQKTAQVTKKKKKTRGNPFKVLMGKVGKLLDHGLTKTQIVRKVKKDINFNDDTIKKAIDIVKEYNKKKKRQSKSSSNNDRIIVSEVKVMQDFLDRYSNASNAELMMRKMFLDAYQNDAELARDVDNTQPGFVPANPQKEMSIINSVLKERGLE